MINPEKQTTDPNIEQTESVISEEQASEQKKRARAILRHIEKRIIGDHESLAAKEEEEIQAYYANMNPREKADILYGKIMAYTVDKQAESVRKKESKKTGEEFEPEEPDPYLISEIKTLLSDSACRETFAQTYAEARIDAKNFRVSELGGLWKNANDEMQQKESSYKELERNLNLHKVIGRGKISSAKARMERLAENLSTLEQRKQHITSLEGLEKTAENTDVAAQLQYEQLKEYRKQLKEGFVWLPSRKKIHQKTVSAILNHRWPVLVGEAGSGKSDQADAAAIELTGYPPTEIECEATTGEKQLIGDIAIDTESGGSYEEYGPLMQAFTGYDDSRQETPQFTGRIARFDESGRLGPRAYSIIKKARQKKPGDDFYGHPVLPGAGAIWTSNPVGERYPGRHAPDPAMRRELAEIKVDYPDMSEESPELYEFALTALLDENDHIAIAKEEIAPAYDKKEIPINQRQILEDGSIIIAKDEIISDMSDAKHGALWRFCGAIKALQESFVHGNEGTTEKYPETLLRFKGDDEGNNIRIATDGTGEPLTLFESTVTLGELTSWMAGFNERRQKQDEEFRVDTLTEWLNFKIKTYIDQADKTDKEKIEAIFRHFHFLEDTLPEVSHVDPLTPKEIGYLSPRVPRPVHVERPQVSEAEVPAEEAPKEVKEYETRQVLLEDGTKVLMKAQEFTFGKGKAAVSILTGRKFRLGGEDFSFAGVVEDEKSEHHGKPLGQLANEENLYRIFSAEELDLGILSHESEELIAEVERIKEDVEDFCELENE